MTNGDENLPVGLLRHWCFGDRPEAEKEFFSDPESAHGILTRWRLQAAAYYFCRNFLPPEQQEEYGAIYRARSMTDFRQEMEYRELEKLFCKHQIRFLPIKGADLAWRVYPAGALRAKCDLDILIHPDDCDAALAVLRKAQWEMPYHYRHRNHFPAMSHHNVMLELHFRLPHFPKFSDEMIWEELRRAEGSRFQLPPELNLLLLFHHSRIHRWDNGHRLLLDCGFLLKHDGVPDLKKLRALTGRLELADPELLFAAFPDFFPESFPADRTVTPAAKMLRGIMATPGNLSIDAHAVVMSVSSRFNLRWWRQRLLGLGFSPVRMATGNSSGNYGRLFRDYLRMLARKFRYFIRHRHGSDDRRFIHRLRRFELLEQKLKADVRRMAGLQQKTGSAPGK